MHANAFDEFVSNLGQNLGRKSSCLADHLKIGPLVRGYRHLPAVVVFDSEEMRCGQSECHMSVPEYEGRWEGMWTY